MNLITGKLVTLLCLSMITYALPSDFPFSTADAIRKRWYSVNDLHPPNHRDAVKPKTTYNYPWPETCGGNTPIHTIRFCYVDTRSADRLGPIVDAAITKWASAFQVSALSIGLDPGTGGDRKVLCGDEQVAGDALNIQDMTEEDDEDHNFSTKCLTETTTGYTYLLEQHPHGTRGRHSLKFCHWKPGYDINPEQKAEAVLVMAHELGHAIGLAHEHQRPDRDNYLKYNCKNIQGYEEMKDLADIDEHVVFEDDTPDSERWNQCCNLADVAKYYLPMAQAFVKGHYADLGQTYWEDFVYSESAFDFESIMIYNSDDGSIEESKTVITKLDDGGRIYMGGNKNPAQAGPSEGDIARVSQLYPKGGTENDAMRLANWGPPRTSNLDHPSANFWKPGMIKIRDSETTVYPHQADHPTC